MDSALKALVELAQQFREAAEEHQELIEANADAEQVAILQAVDRQNAIARSEARLSSLSREVRMAAAVAHE